MRAHKLENVRGLIESEIVRMIAALDLMDGDCDLEPECCDEEVEAMITGGKGGALSSLGEMACIRYTTRSFRGSHSGSAGGVIGLDF